YPYSTWNRSEMQSLLRFRIQNRGRAGRKSGERRCQGDTPPTAQNVECRKKSGEERLLNSSFCTLSYPTEPSISIWIRRFSSTAYSIGSSRVHGSIKPSTIIDIASDSLRPRLIR